MSVDADFWRGRRVLITGHTGFKGAWLTMWLQLLGAEVSGFAVAPPTKPSLFELAGVGEHCETFAGDIADPAAVSGAIRAARPEVVIHMAAQPLVRRSYEDPEGTYRTNVMGTVNVLEAVRRHRGDTRVLITVTSDKCYANDGDIGRPFREEDPLGGRDPYSSSKACAELVTSAYGRSFFGDPDGTRLAAARAGNVVGGGDWGADRLLADVMSAALAGTSVSIRNPAAVRPWQHVLNPLSGYLMLAQRLWVDPDLEAAFNFGPPPGDERPVASIVGSLAEKWPGGIDVRQETEPQPHEAATLRLDSTRAHDRLGWRPIVGLDAALQSIVDWYMELAQGRDVRAVTLGQIERLNLGALAT